MLPDYNDIRDAVLVDPLWHDGNGVPRYQPFKPDMLGVYDKFAFLATIECQSCSQRMSVGEGWFTHTFVPEEDGTYRLQMFTIEYLAERFSYGDPPWHYCRGAGESMSSIAVRIDEAWERPRGKTVWVRRPDIEQVDVTPEWMLEPDVP